MNDVEQPSKHRTWSELGAVTQAALRCKEPVFWAFLRESGFTVTKIEDEEASAVVVRSVCEIESRSELADHSNAQAIWHDLDNLFQAWLARER
jgi:predicted nicotinamide N-methyase